MMEITLKPKTVSLFFLSVVIFLTSVHCVVTVLSFYFDNNAIISILVELFDLDLEDNIPTFYSAFAMLSCSPLFFIIAARQKEGLSYEKLCWLGLSGIFFFLAFDEALQIHEKIGDITENHIKATGFLYFPWVVPYVFAVLVFVLCYLKFILGLPKKTALLFILSGTIFLSGAVVLDMLGGKEAELHGYETITYYTLYTIEEFLEMSGIVLLLFTLLSYIETQFGHICITLQFRKTD